MGSTENGDDLAEEIKNLEKFGFLDNVTGRFTFSACVTCGGPTLGHKGEDGACQAKTKMKKEEKDLVEEVLQREPGFEVALAKLDKRPGMKVCNLCNKVFPNRYDLESHMKFEEKKINFKSRLGLVDEESNEENSTNEYMKGLNNLLEKMVEKKQDPSLSYLSKPKPPPSWTSGDFERYKDQVQVWTENNKDNE